MFAPISCERLNSVFVLSVSVSFGQKKIWCCAECTIMATVSVREITLDKVALK